MEGLSGRGRGWVLGRAGCGKNREIADGNKGADDEEQSGDAQPVYRTYPAGELQPLDL